jgi:hypothetical protein
MTLWQAITTVISAAALVGVYINWLQVKATKDQVGLLVEERREKSTWATKHADALGLVLKTNQSIVLKSGVTPGYTHVFKDEGLRILIETYLVERDHDRGAMSGRVLQADHFALPIVQDVIQKTIKTVESFKLQYPDEASKLGL